MHEISANLRIKVDFAPGGKSEQWADVICEELPAIGTLDMKEEATQLLPDFMIKPADRFPNFKGRHYGWKREDGLTAMPTKPMVYDVETSSFGTKVKPVCAIGWDGEFWWCWQPSEACEDFIPNKAPFVAHNRSFDASMTTGERRGLCSMAVAAMLFGMSENQQNVARANKNVPWASVGLTCMPSLAALSEFCRLGDLDKSVRDLCVEQDYGTNLQLEYLDQIVEYCVKDVHRTAQVWYRIYTAAQEQCSDPVFWYGQYLLSSFCLPVTPKFHDWFMNLTAHINKEFSGYQTILEKLKLECYPELEWPINCNLQPACPLLIKAMTARKSGKRIIPIFKKLERFWVVLKQLYTLARNEYFAECEKQLPLYPWGVEYGIPKWYGKLEATGTNTILPTFLELEFNSERVYHAGHNYPVIFKQDGEVSGRWATDKVNRELYSFPDKGFDVLAFIELAIVSDIFVKFRKRLSFVRTEEIDGQSWYYPSIHSFGTVTGRLTDPLLHVAPKHNPKVPGSEILGLFPAPDGWKYVHADYDSQEVGFMSLVADSVIGELNSCPFSQAGNEGDLHALVWSLLPKQYVPTRDKAKNYTFALLFGGSAKGISDRLQLAGCPKEEADAYAAAFIRGYKGEKAYGKWVGGQASLYYNAIAARADRDVLHTLFFSRPAPLPLQKRFCGKEEKLTRENSIIQGTGSDLLRATYAYVDIYARHYGIECKPAVSVHDRLVWLVPDNHIDRFAILLQAVHALIMADLYRTVRVPQVPERYVFFSGIDITHGLQWCKDHRMITPSNPNGFEVYTHCSAILPK